MTEQGPIEQLRSAKKNPGAILMGAPLGGFVPVATFTVAHHELRHVHDGVLTLAPWWHPGWALVAGGLVYSAKTVWQWGRLSFDCPWKATGFVLLIEGVMVFSGVEALADAALAYLVAINAIATGCLLAARDQSDRRLRSVEQGALQLPIPNGANDPPAVGRFVQLTSRVASGPRPITKPRSTTALLPPTKPASGDASDDPLYDRAVAFVTAADSCSVSAIQRALNIGYNKAAKLVERMESEGVVGPRSARAGGRREVAATSA